MKVIPLTCALLSGLKYLAIDCSTGDCDRFETLITLYGVMNIGQSVIFVNSKKMADSLGRDMAKDGYTVSVLHGGIAPAQRTLVSNHIMLDTSAATYLSRVPSTEHILSFRMQVMQSFRDNETTVLIATDVFARFPSRCHNLA